MDNEKKEHIPGIYNYCDRWCERCSFTSKCLLFSRESKIRTYEILNNGDHTGIEKIFEEEFNKLSEETDAGDFDEFAFDDEEDDDFFVEDDQDEDSKQEDITDFRENDNHPLSVLSYEYFDKTHQLIKELDKRYDFSTSPGAQPDDDESYKKLFDSFEVVAWFHAFINVKIKRALFGKNEMMKEDDDEMKEISKYDMDGTAKIASIGVSRSINALNNLYTLIPEYNETISELLVLLGKIKNHIEEEFPDCMEFVRPGLDTSE